MPKKIKDPKRITRKKSKYLMAKQQKTLPKGKHRRIFQFLPSELGVQEPVKNEYRERRYYTAVVDTFKAPVYMSKQEAKKAAAEYYAQIRREILTELRQSMQSTIVIPEVFDPEGLTTIDLSSLTTAGEKNAEAQ